MIIYELAEIIQTIIIDRFTDLQKDISTFDRSPDFDFNRFPNWVKRNKYTGNLGEYIACLYLINCHNIRDVQLIAEECDYLGYDIIAKKNDHDVFIEVKTSTYSNNRNIASFFLTQNELTAAKDKCDSYFLFYIIIDETRKIAVGRIIHNLYHIVENNLPQCCYFDKEVKVEIEQYQIHMNVNSDNPPIPLDIEYKIALEKRNAHK